MTDQGGAKEFINESRINVPRDSIVHRWKNPRKNRFQDKKSTCLHHEPEKNEIFHRVLLPTSERAAKKEFYSKERQLCKKKMLTSEAKLITENLTIFGVQENFQELGRVWRANQMTNMEKFCLTQIQYDGTLWCCTIILGFSLQVLSKTIHSEFTKSIFKISSSLILTIIQVFLFKQEELFQIKHCPWLTLLEWWL